MAARVRQKPSSLEPVLHSLSSRATHVVTRVSLFAHQITAPNKKRRHGALLANTRHANHNLCPTTAQHDPNTFNLPPPTAYSTFMAAAIKAVTPSSLAASLSTPEVPARRAFTTFGIRACAACTKTDAPAESRCDALAPLATNNSANSCKRGVISGVARAGGGNGGKRARVSGGPEWQQPLLAVEGGAGEEGGGHVWVGL